MNRADLTARCGRILGITGGGAVQLAGFLSFMLGWLIVALFAGFTATGLWLGWGLSWFEAKGLGFGLTLLAVGIETVGSARLIREVGFSLGYGAAGLIAFMATAPFANGDLLATQALLTGSLASLSLSVVAALRHPEQVARIVRSARAYLNGARKDGSAWNFFGCIVTPGVPAAGLGFALYSLLNPAVPAQAASWTIAQYEAAGIQAQTGHPALPHLLPAPAWVSSTWLWLALAGLSAIGLYIGCRRVGSGDPSRGFRLWLLALFEAGGALGVVASIAGAVRAADNTTRVVCLLLAVVLTAATFGTGRRRRLIINRYGHHDPMFNG